MDLFRILELAGFQSLNKGAGGGKISKLVDMVTRLVNILIKVRAGDIVLYNIPAHYNLMRVVFFLKRLKRFKLVVHCYDIESLRYSIPMALSDRERVLLNGSDVILCPSVRSEAILRRLGVTSRCVPVHVWDYLYPEDVTVPAGDGRVVFAGNPAKAGFITQLGELSTSFTIWAHGYQTDSSNVRSMGVGASPNRLPEVAQGSWGLVWDGDSIHGEQVGALGQYTKIMTTHKAGLYLAAGLPLITWGQNGMAPFVTQHGLGICVESLSELDELLPALPKLEYDQYRARAREISRLIRSGHFLAEALKKV